MTSVAKSSTSSSSVLSESLHSGSYDGGLPESLISPLHFDDDVELSSYIDEEAEEATLILPSSQWVEPVPVAIVIPDIGANGLQDFCSVIEVQGEVQRLEDEMSQERQDIRRVRDAIVGFSDKHSLYLDKDASQEGPQSVAACPPAMPTDSVVTGHIKGKDDAQNVFQDWQPDAQSKKRSREDPQEGKGKEASNAKAVDASLENSTSMLDRTSKSMPATSSKIKLWMFGNSLKTMHDEEEPPADDKGKRKINCKMPNANINGQQSDSGWKQKQHYHWRKLVNLPIPHNPKRRSHWPPWLHPAFQIEDDGLIPRISHSDLQLLHQGALYCPIRTKSYRNLFNLVLGPIACWGRDDEIAETVEAIGRSAGSYHLANLSEHIDRDIVPREELQNNYLFIARFLGNFPTFASFQQRDEEYRQTLLEQVYMQLTDQMLKWYGGQGQVDDYTLWATARLGVLDQDRMRPMSPKDLNSRELSEWQQRIDACETMEEAVTVTEEVFGPLEQIDYYDKPKVDLQAVWSPCQCSICNRSRKRAKLD